MTTKTLTQRVSETDTMQVNSDDRQANLKIANPQDDLSNLDLMIEEAKQQKYEMYRANPALANKEALGRMFKGTGSFIGNTLRYLVFWPKFIEECVWATEDSWKDENGSYTTDSKNTREQVTTLFTISGIASSIGASAYGWCNYSNGNIGIVPTLALNIGLFGGTASLAYDGLKSWFNYAREQAIESYNTKSSVNSQEKK